MYGLVVRSKLYEKGQVMKKKVVKVVVVLALVWLCLGCGTLKGAFHDSAWALDKLGDNITLQETAK